MQVDGTGRLTPDVEGVAIAEGSGHVVVSGQGSDDYVVYVNVLGSLGGLPQLPLDSAALSIGGIITAVAALLVTLVGAILGGLAGMRFHRKIDRADLGH